MAFGLMRWWEAWRFGKDAAAATERAKRRVILAKEVLRRLKEESGLAAAPTEAEVCNVLLMLQRMGRMK